MIAWLGPVVFLKGVSEFVRDTETSGSVPQQRDEHEVGVQVGRCGQPVAGEWGRLSPSCRRHLLGTCNRSVKPARF